MSDNSKHPSHNVYAVTDSGQSDRKDKWTLIGAAWSGSNNSFSLVIDAIAVPWLTGHPREFRVILQERVQRDNGSNQRNDNQRGQSGRR